MFNITAVYVEQRQTTGAGEHHSRAAAGSLAFSNDTFLSMHVNPPPILHPSTVPLHQHQKGIECTAFCPNMMVDWRYYSFGGCCNFCAYHDHDFRVNRLRWGLETEMWSYDIQQSTAWLVCYNKTLPIWFTIKSIQINNRFGLYVDL